MSAEANKFHFVSAQLKNKVRIAPKRFIYQSKALEYSTAA
jgi:hypothetical protein